MTQPTDLIMFLHIPKTGGISFRRMLKARILLENLSKLSRRHALLGYYNISSYQERLAYVQGLEPARRGMIRYFEGHYGFGVHEVLQRPCKYMTLLRDPVERTISNYYHLQRPEVRERDGIPEVPLAEFILMGKPWRGTFFLDNCQVRYIAGENGKPLSVPFGEITEKDLATAKDRLSNVFQFIGLTERFDESSVLLQNTLGWRHAYYVKTNVNPDRVPKEELNEDAIALVKTHNQFDIELYSFAADLFEKAVRGAGKDFANRVRSLQRVNRVLASLGGSPGQVLGGRRQKAK